MLSATMLSASMLRVIILNVAMLITAMLRLIMLRVLSANMQTALTLSETMLSVAMYYFIMLSATMLSASMLRVIILNVAMVCAATSSVDCRGIKERAEAAQQLFRHLFMLNINKRIRRKKLLNSSLPFGLALHLKSYELLKNTLPAGPLLYSFLWP
jgi:hypothetical protein